MTTTTLPTRRQLLNKVPEVTIWFWIIKILCTTVGESFADYINETLGVGLVPTTVLFTVAFAVVLTVQMRMNRYVPAVYWLAVLVTFALGTATGDWTLELTGWGPGRAVLLPLALIALVTALWRYGANPVLAFWLAYILTRPLGANIGDFLALPSSEKGLGLGTFGTSLVFLGAIAATVVYLSISKADVIQDGTRPGEARDADPRRERISLMAFGALSLATIGLLAYTSSQPHVSSLGEEGAAPSCSSSSTLTAPAARAKVASSFPSGQVDAFRTISQDTLDMVSSGDQPGAASRITDLETAWDNAEESLVAQDCGAWTYVDGEIDNVLTAVRAPNPDQTTETDALGTLVSTLGG